jgi:acetyl esterase/lipase
MRPLQPALVWLLMALNCSSALAATDVLNLPYATVGAKALRLDLHLPTGTRKAPLVVYVHGGAWSAGDKTQYPAFLVERGYAVASVDFRSTDEAPFPANVHDIKAAIRFLRARATTYGSTTKPPSARCSHATASMTPLPLSPGAPPCSNPVP